MRALTVGQNTQLSIPLLDPNRIGFPDPNLAESEPDGLLAAGGDLTVEWLLCAYSLGVFPWFSDDHEPILWWSPSERAVLTPGTMTVRRSLAKRIRNGGFKVAFDRDFRAVINACAGPRRPPPQVNQDASDGINLGSVDLEQAEDTAAGTWITPNMLKAYIELHEAGFAHCVSVYLNDDLVGGLYGVSLGQMFFGESMFSKTPDASKVAFFHLQVALANWGFSRIDCQMMTPHLASLGVQPLPRDQFLEELAENDLSKTRRGPWSFAPS